MNKILIIGGAGFIGSNLTVRLLEKGYVVTILDNLSQQVHGLTPEHTSFSYSFIKGKAHFIHGTINSRSDLEKALIDQDVVINFAAETGTDQSMHKIEQYTLVNIGGTALLLDILTNRKHTVKKLIIASSRAVYGEGKYFSDELGIVYPKHRHEASMRQGNFNVTYKDVTDTLKPMATDEESKVHPVSVYGITKQLQEQLIMTVCPCIGIAAVAFRYQNVYGCGQSLSNPYTGILSIFSSLIKNDKVINIFEDGKESRDFVYIDDVVDATILGIEKEEANNEIFNVGTGIAIDINTVVEELFTHYQKRVPVKISGEYRIGDIRHNFADLTKIKRVLGFEPKNDFKEGLKKLVDWANNQTSIPKILT
ncbi:NAD-dependent epimerase/dehydratase family protein [Spirosoma koreense]